MAGEHVDEVRIHMASTFYDFTRREWSWICRCPERGTWWPTRNAARKEGDAHLAEANGG